MNKVLDSQKPQYETKKKLIVGIVLNPLNKLKS